MNVRIAEDWKELLKEEFSKPYFEELTSFVKGEYGKETTYVAGFSQNVVTKGTSTDITAVETNDNIQVVNGEVVLSEAQPVVVYDFAGRVVFEGTTSHINGLANGMYVVKTPSAVMKVVIK